VGSGIWWGLTVKLAAMIHGIRIEVTGDEIPEKENAVLICNHQQTTDIVFLLYLALQKGRQGDMLWFVKDSLKYVPGIGWGMWFFDSLFVKRQWTLDQGPIKGTRLTPDKLKRVQNSATRRGKVPLKHLMTPHSRGFNATLSGLGDYLDAVYDVTIGYEVGVPTLWQYIGGLAPVAHFHIRRFPMKSLPEESGERTKWLQAQFEIKDQLLDEFFKEQKFAPVKEAASRAGGTFQA
jgi:hypothetical protein